MTAVEERVAQGVRWLDAVRPGWESKIQTKDLDLANPDKCVLGQVFADQRADDAATWYRGYNWTVDNLLSYDEAADCGFDAHTGLDVSSITQFAALERAWLKVLAERAAK